MGAGGAQAQESEAPATQSDEPAAPAAKSPWSFRATSYLWFAGINGDVGVGGLGPVDVDVSFGDIFGNLDWTPPPIMLVGEVRYDRFGFITDFIYLGLDGEGATAVPVPITAEAELDTIVWTFAGAYRAIENDTFSLDLRAGGRLWNLQSEVTLAAPGATLQASGSKTWVDPIIGIAGQVNLGDGFALRAVGDVGGFGAAADIDWQVVGALQYQLNDSIALEAGYRYLAVDYQDGGFIFDAALSGPIMGASFRF
jgi:opacity protein-like surface antigen